MGDWIDGEGCENARARALSLSVSLSLSLSLSQHTWCRGAGVPRGRRLSMPWVRRRRLLVPPPSADGDRGHVDGDGDDPRQRICDKQESRISSAAILSGVGVG
jgi:hypothetical protein